MADLGAGITSYPGVIDSNPTPELPNNPLYPITRLPGEGAIAGVIAIETTLGVNPMGSKVSVKELLDVSLNADGTPKLVLPKQWAVGHEEATVITGNPLAQVINVGQLYNGYSHQSAAAPLDSFSQNLFMKAGTYTLYILGITDTDCGTVTWYMDTTATVIGSHSWLSNPQVLNVIKTVAITIPTDGWHLLIGKVTSGFNEAKLTKIWIK